MAGIGRAHQRRHDGALVLGAIAEIDRPGLEQGRTALAAILRTLQRLGEIGQDGRAHLIEIAGHRIGECQLIRRLAEQGRFFLVHEAPGDGLKEAARGKRAARSTHAVLDGCGHRAAPAFRRGQGLAGQGVITLGAGDFLDQVG